MCLKMPWRTLVCAIFTLIGFASHAAPLLNGISVHSELGHEQFLGSLYSETLSDNADTLIGSPVAKRMELKILTPEGLAVRRFSRMWIEGMAINNSSTLLTSQADNMVKFDGMFKGRLLQNDHIVFSLTPQQGVTISMNEVLLGTIADDEFFSLLLSTWIGRVPLSSGYKEDLLKTGDVSSALRSRYDSIRFDPVRSQAITAWNTPETQPAVVSSSPPASAASSLSSAPAIAARVELPALTQPEPVSSLATFSSASSEALPEQTDIVFSSAAASLPVDEDEDETGPALTAQSLLARQFYVSDMLKKVRSNVRYPRRAQERNQEGGVRIAITVDRQGNIANMSWIEESRFDLLNNEAWEAVKRSAPFPPMPEALDMQTFEFSAPITFEMRR